MELTIEDHQRIKEAFGKAFPYSSGHGMDNFYSGYEAATLFERQELRNKVIEECIEQLKDTREGDMIIRLLNSLKTK